LKQIQLGNRTSKVQLLHCGSAGRRLSQSETARQQTNGAQFVPHGTPFVVFTV
jgi:hypothetical protein